MNKIEYPEHYYINRKMHWSGISEIKWNDWKWQFKNRIYKYEDLKRLYKTFDQKKLKEVFDKYRFSITPYYFCLLDIESGDDPLAKQVLPDPQELKSNKYLYNDPFNEKKKSPVNNLIKRYPDRVVITLTDQCPSFCRYCTRKWIWSDIVNFNNDDLDNISNYLEVNKQIREVIISGGEPLLLEDEILDNILNRLFSISSIETIRIGTRILTYLPQRINKKTMNLLAKYKPLWIITHFNHSKEFTPKTVEAIDLLIKSGVVICNQSVLLKGVNDEVSIIKDLIHTLQNNRIKPYYLFQCDLVEGTEHFHVPLKKGIEIMKQLRGNTGGLCIPTFVIDLPDGGKVPVLPDYIIEQNHGNVVFQNYENKLINYPDIGSKKRK